MLDTDIISNATSCNPVNVAANWPLIESALADHGITDLPSLLAAVATVATETGHIFAPIDERGGDAYFSRMYDGKLNLGNVMPGDGARYHGRGFIQITGRDNYTRYGKALGVDLVNNPGLANDPRVAAAVFAEYFDERKIANAARAGQWEKTRRLVNGGLNGWSEYSRYLTNLIGAFQP